MLVYDAAVRHQMVLKGRYKEHSGSWSVQEELLSCRREIHNQRASQKLPQAYSYNSEDTQYDILRGRINGRLKCGKLTAVPLGWRRK